MFAWLRSLAYTIVFYGLSVPIVLLAVPAALSPRALHFFVYTWVSVHAWCVRWLLGISVKIEGEIPQGQVLVASRHESAFETTELVRLLNLPVVVLKSELAAIPFWGWVAQRYGMIPVEREGSSKALRAMLRAATAARNSGRTVVIFPEGTRVPYGEEAPLRAGFAGLYRSLNLPVVPVAIDIGRLWPKSGFVKKSGVITIRFGEALPTGLSRQEIEALVHQQINALNP